MHRRHLLALAAATLASPALAQSGAWPGRQQVRIVIPFPPGGFADSVTRVMVPAMTEAMGQTVVVENRPGAGGTIGADVVAKAAPDGYTLAVSHASPHGIAPGVYPQLPYDPVSDFAHLTLICETPTALMVQRSSGIATAQDYLARARATGIRFGTSGIGSIGHLQGEVLAREAGGAKLEHVPYRGTAPALQDLLAGAIESIFEPIAGLVPQMREGGPLRPLAVSTPRRIAVLPDVPTLAELGLGEATATAWMGFSAPKSLPPAIGARITEVAQAVLGRPEVRARMEELAVFPAEPPLTGPAYANFIETYMRKWTGVARGANIVAS
ncbi:tripartite tricarboxylate transporter substrate binding protein [Belnapia sp. T6]|uniref:Tripartite tricarboxylate transporter substrate binding protein n=1 Tax=Belnapia mucosa TaxID=2804532 RepID=A0ABS1UZA6_9PROT|nr:tripartite tricarboxylate transporter substrate binding protein [Belnapia mucosa]MBL6454342.1 tripartite tricarboxylate transporter substrate binding protein [Belnapia mucosa]